MDTSASQYQVWDPADMGVDPAKVDDLLARARREVDEGLLPSCQLALARDGRLVAFETIGAAEPGSRYVIFSCTKAVVAGLVWMLLGEAKLALDEKVCEVVPEFGTNGKDVITVEQLLTHTAGFPQAPLGPPDWHDRDARLARFASWRLNWEPGTRFEYHPSSAHWVLAEIVERLDGEDYRQLVGTRIAEPLGIDGLVLGVPEDEQGDIVDLVSVGSPPTPEELEAVLGVSGLDLGEVTEEALLGFNGPATRAVGVPGGGAVATAADIALYYQALLHDPLGLWDPEVRADATGNIRNTFPDPMMGVPANRTGGLVVAGDDGKAHMRMSFGRTTSPRTFGHDGAGGQVAWADPESGLSFSYVTNGLDANPLRSGRRGNGLSSRAGVCVAGAG